MPTKANVSAQFMCSELLFSKSRAYDAGRDPSDSDELTLNTLLVGGDRGRGGKPAPGTTVDGRTPFREAELMQTSGAILRATLVQTSLVATSCGGIQNYVQFLVPPLGLFSEGLFFFFF